jgi:hypothetical protein
MLVFVLLFVVFFYRGLEVPDTFSETFAEVCELAGAEQKERDRDDDNDFGNSNFTAHGSTLLRSSSLRLQTSAGKAIFAYENSRLPRAGSQRARILMPSGAVTNGRIGSLSLGCVR